VNRCVSCHFLAFIERTGEYRRYIPWNEIDDSYLDVKDKYLIGCERGVWMTRTSEEIENRVHEEINKNRNETCYFFMRQHDMDFNTAYDLWKIRNDNRQLKRSYKYTRWALWIATAGIIMNVLVSLFKD